MPGNDARLASLNVQEVTFTGPIDWKVWVSADRETITYRATDSAEPTR